jgi:hypothetical protein
LSSAAKERASIRGAAFRAVHGHSPIRPNTAPSIYHRLDLLPPEPRQALQERVRQYVDARLALYRAIPDSAKVRAANACATALQEEIWTRAVAAVREAPLPQLAGQLLTR